MPQPSKLGAEPSNEEIEGVPAHLWDMDAIRAAAHHIGMSRTMDMGQGDSDDIKLILKLRNALLGAASRAVSLEPDEVAQALEDRGIHNLIEAEYDNVAQRAAFIDGAFWAMVRPDHTGPAELIGRYVSDAQIGAALEAQDQRMGYSRVERMRDALVAASLAQHLSLKASLQWALSQLDAKEVDAKQLDRAKNLVAA